MISNNLDYLKTHPYVSDKASIEIYHQPFDHIVINNLFRDDIYQQISDNFMSTISRTKPYKDMPGAVHGYEGYIYGMKKQDCINGYDFFISDIWRNFNMITFGILLNKYTALSTHWHKAPSKPGFIHNDCNICSVMDEPDDCVLTGNCVYSDDTDVRQPDSIKMTRSIAILFYLRNSIQKLNDGGTSIYTNYKFHSKIKEIPPINNSVFVFAVGPKSYHGFTGASFDRSAVVQWFHSSPAYILHKYLPDFKERQRKNQNIFERWQPSMPIWDIRKDPQYNKLFPTFTNMQEILQ